MPLLFVGMLAALQKLIDNAVDTEENRVRRLVVENVHIVCCGANMVTPRGVLTMSFGQQLPLGNETQVTGGIRCLAPVRWCLQHMAIS